MTDLRRKIPLLLTVVSFVAVFFTPYTYAGSIADITYTDLGISISTKSALTNISLNISGPENTPVLKKSLSQNDQVIYLSQFSSIGDGKYTILISAETGKITETTGRVEDGREAKIYKLKETISQSDQFVVDNARIVLSPNTTEK